MDLSHVKRQNKFVGMNFQAVVREGLWLCGFNTEVCAFTPWHIIESRKQEVPLQRIGAHTPVEGSDFRGVPLS